MSLRSIVLLVLLVCAASAEAGAGSGASQDGVVAEAVSKEQYVFDVTLQSGLRVCHIVYRKERLGGKWLLELRKHSGLVLVSQDEVPTTTLSSGELLELISGLISLIQRQHHGLLDSIQLDMTITDALWNDGIGHLRDAAIPSDYRITPKSEIILDAMQSYLAGSATVKDICDLVEGIDRKCGSHAVSMNPVAFQQQYLWKRWGDVKNLPGVGIEQKRVWFAIDLKK